MTKNEAIEIAKRFKNLIDGKIEYDRVYLYGSYAKGEDRKFSDIDIAVVVNSCEKNYMDLVKTLWKLRREVDTRIEPILLIKNRDITGFYDEIKRTGEEIG